MVVGLATLLRKKDPIPIAIPVVSSGDVGDACGVAFEKAAFVSGQVTGCGSGTEGMSELLVFMFTFTCLQNT